MLLRFATVATMVAAVAACADASGHPPGGDASVWDDASAMSYSLELLSPPIDTVVGVGAVVPVAARLTDRTGAPVAGATIVFGIEGNAYGSSLSDLEVTSDENGEAETRLSTSRTGEGSFYLRVSTANAPSAGRVLYVAASAVGKAEVSLSYSGTRTLGEVELAVVPGGSCGSAATLRAEGTLTWPTGMSQATISHLPAGGLFALTAHARSSVGGYAADACVDGLVVGLLETISIDLELVDRPVFVDDALSGQVSIEGGAFGTWLAGIGEDALEAHVGASGGDGQLLYDALEDELRHGGDALGADAVAALATPSAVAALDDELDGYGVGPSAVATKLVEGIAYLAPSLRLLGELAFPVIGEPSFTIASVAIVIEGATFPLENDPLGLVGVEISLPGAFAVGQAGYHVSDAVLDFSSDDIGALFLEALSFALASSLEAHFIPYLGLDRLFATQSLSTYCAAASCRAAVAMRVFDRLKAALDDAFHAASVTHAELRLAGPIELLDTNGDTLVDAASASDGLVSWTAASATDPIASTFTLFATSLPSP